MPADIETFGDAVETQDRSGELLPWSPPSMRRLNLSDAEFFAATPAVDGTTDKDKS
jgi:hypothetical protein